MPHKPDTPFLSEGAPLLPSITNTRELQVTLGRVQWHGKMLDGQRSCELQVTLGHIDKSFTLRTYTRFIKGNNIDRGKKLEEAFKNVAENVAKITLNNPKCGQN
tara:strand:- start:76 stop:387 length:312 start_codon:yes stop_codon:yes gene_type:complete